VLVLPTFYPKVDPIKQAYAFLDETRNRYGQKSKEYNEAWKMYRFIVDMYKEGGE
jgi:hypothetical protein